MQERAAWLAETAANALHSARVSLGHAADVTRDVDAYLKRSEQEVFELPAQAHQVQFAEEARRSSGTRSTSPPRPMTGCAPAGAGSTRSGTAWATALAP